MRINSIHIFNQYTNKIYNKNEKFSSVSNLPAFKGSISSTPCKKLIKNRSVSYYFRNDLNWVKLKEYLTNRFRNNEKVNTYIWGCANGQEAYSLSMLFQDNESDKKFFPVYAMDKSKNIIRKNKTKQKDGILLDNDEYYRISENLHNMGYINTKCFIDRPPPWLIGDIKLKDCVTKQVKFSYSDITKDLNKIDNKNSSIVMCRNMWPYINPENYDKCAKTMYDKLSLGSVVIIGDYDMTGELFVKKSDTFPLSLINAGFKPNDIALGIFGHHPLYFDDFYTLIYEK